ncbi:ABC transporter substrate-binding protein [Nocardioides sp. zg-1228]|uniref:ABC transporter substrate-binding protein n=1 Tax=Nocardioides sp. zg-1228 TaxID=2763008 RepID=UPI0016425ACB|nr:extracellular solute-binding protein [Nocardioides sp. zg-1228]MBC2932111.1 extracellular solute-binding protein [Nocardioides sp. zg-1228]QSF57657.1 extracellular solute-binding protein [Nocardioides sp. zg-1228]
MRHSTTRRKAAVGAALALVAGTTAACGGDSDASQASLGKDDVLTITTFSDFGYDALIEQWNADPERPFSVKMTKIADWDPWKQTMTQALQAGDGLTDVIAIEGDAMPQFLTDGASEQFADLTDPSLDDRWVEYAYENGQTADGKQVAYPTDAGPEGFCYRADLFEKAGLPSDREEVKAVFESWDSYFAAGEQLTEELPGTKWFDSSGAIAQAMLNQTEFPFQTEDNEVEVNNPELQNVWETVTSKVDTLSPRVVQWDEDWEAGFTNDGFATIPCPGWMFSNVKSAAPDVEGWDFVDAFPGGGGNWGGSYLAVPMQSEHQEEAKELANWLTDTEQQLAAFEAAGNYPANIGAQESLAADNITDPYFNDAPTAQILANRAAAVEPGHPYKGDKYSDILGLFLTAIQRVDEGTSPDKSWATFEQAVESLS